MVAFFVGWSLWIQMTFVLMGCLVATIGIGWLRNLYTWRRNRALIKLHGPTGIPRQDLEARAGANISDVPFGIRALQMGIEVEGVWISRSNTPVPGSPVLSAQKSRAPSLAPSIIGGASIGSAVSSTRPAFSHPDEIQTDQNQRVTHAASTGAPSLNLESFASFGSDPLDSALDFSTFDADSSAAAYSSTLDALEGRGRSWGKRSPEDGQRSRQKSRSDISVSNYGQSVREGSPSPPALTDGVSRADTPVSEVRSNLTYLSESNHRLSHVAETGQLGHRSRHLKHTEAVIPAYGDPSIYRSTFNFGPQMGRPTPTKYPSSPASPGSPPAFLSPSSQSYTWSPTSPKSPLTPGRSPLTTRPKSRSLSESTVPIVHAPQPVTIRYPDFEVDTLASDPPNLNFDFQPSIPQIRTPSGLVLPATSPLVVSPNISDYFQEPQKSPLFPNTRARQSVVLTDIPGMISPPEPAITSLSRPLDYRRVNDNFEVKRGNKGLYVPLELPLLSVPVPPPVTLDKPVPRKLAKKRLQAAHRRSQSTPLMQLTAR